GQSRSERIVGPGEHGEEPGRALQRRAGDGVDENELGKCLGVGGGQMADEDRSEGVADHDLLRLPLTADLGVEREQVVDERSQPGSRRQAPGADQTGLGWAEPSSAGLVMGLMRTSSGSASGWEAARWLTRIDPKEWPTTLGFACRCRPISVPSANR